MFSWTEEQVEQLISLRKKSYSGSQIAAIMGGLSRAAVIGKLYRLRRKGDERVAFLPVPVPRPTPPAQSPRPKRPPRPLPVPIEEPKPDTEPGAPPVIHYGVEAVVNLRSNQCRWISGDTRTGEFFFCTAKALRPGCPYCRKHAALAYGKRFS